MEFVKRDDAGPNDRPLAGPKVGQGQVSKGHAKAGAYRWSDYKNLALVEEAARDF